nr:reverse transcriptase domain-containing protein [Tanacetum cinerariifolium]
MADQRTMAQWLQAPTEGYEDAIVVPAITADNFELKHGLLTLVQNKQFFGHDKEDPHAHVCYFNKITFTLKSLNVSNTSGTLPSNTIANPKSDLKAITTRSGVSYDGPQIPPLPSFLPKVVENKPEAVQSEFPVLISKPVTFPIFEPAIAPIFKDMSFEISFTDVLILMPKFASTLKALIGNKEKLSEMARTPLNENCSAVLLKKLPEKLGDPGKFLILCDFPCMAEFLALADLGASINLMPFSVWKIIYLPDLTPTYFDVDPRVPLILGRSFLKTGRALIDVYEGDLTLRVGKEAITLNLDQTSRYSANYSDMTAKCIDVIDMAYEEYSQEVLGFSNTISSGNPTPYYDPIVSVTSPTLTPFGNSDFLLKEVDAFLAIEDEPTSSEIHLSYLDPEGDILLLEAFLNDDPLLPLPNQRNYMLEVCKELKICEAKSDKSSVDEPPVALKHANFDLKTAGDHRKVQINELNELLDQAYENSMIYKEKKRLHDLKIKNRVFNIGDRVLLFNSRLKIFSGKLKSRWSGPFTISQVYPYGTVELLQPDGPNFKVNGHRLKHYFREDVPKLVVPDLHTFAKDH